MILTVIDVCINY